MTTQDTLLRSIGLTENENKVYLTLLRSGQLSAYELASKTGIYRVHVYDKLKQLMGKGLVSEISLGKKKLYRCASPQKIMDYLDEKKKHIELQQEQVEAQLPTLQQLYNTPQQDTKVEVFSGLEGVKYFLRDVIQKRAEVLIMGVDDRNYEQYLSVFMKQYFRDLKRLKIKERVLTAKGSDTFMFDKKLAPTTTYRLLDEESINPSHTTIYANKVVLVTWGMPPQVIMIENKEIADKYKSYFERMWKTAEKSQPTLPH